MKTYESLVICCKALDLPATWFSEQTLILASVEQFGDLSGATNRKGQYRIKLYLRLTYSS
jgi:hypothetical protein